MDGEGELYLVWRAFQSAHRLDQDRHADPVIQGFGNQPRAGFRHRTVEHRHVADAHRARFPIGSSQVDVYPIQRRNIFIIIARLPPDHTGLARSEAHPATGAVERIYAPDGGDARESLPIDVRDDQADLIHMRRQQDPPAGFGFGFHHTDQVAQAVFGDVIALAFDFGPHDLSEFGFASRGPVGLHQFAN